MIQLDKIVQLDGLVQIGYFPGFLYLSSAGIISLLLDRDEQNWPIRWLQLPKFVCSSLHPLPTWFLVLTSTGDLRWAAIIIMVRANGLGGGGGIQDSKRVGINKKWELTGQCTSQIKNAQLCVGRSDSVATQWSKGDYPSCRFLLSIQAQNTQIKDFLKLQLLHTLPQN